MKRDTIAILAGTILCLGMFAAHSRGESDVLTTGKLILSWARSVYEADLKTQKMVALPKLDDTSAIYEQVSIIDDDRFLFDRWGTEREIYEYNRKTHTSKLIRAGRGPTYIPEHNKFFFYYHNPETKQTRLYVADFKEPITSARQVDKEEPEATLPPVIQVSRDEVVFPKPTKDLHNYITWRYNVVTAELKALPLQNCAPVIWRSATQQLLCADVPKQRYYLTDLEGKKKEYLPKLGDALVAAYIPQLDTLILGISRVQLNPPLGEVQDIWAYQFANGKKTKLLKVAPIGRSAAIWYEH